jgi:acetyl-CoA/propionyl-CoA carboxylase biotin carboxyl carrier protein
MRAADIPAHPFHRLLIANRGEIAVRVIRAARDAGITSIAVYADQDRDALHTRMADEAFALHGDTPQSSYLSIEKILSAARRSHAEAIHPGYGFLSENAEFAQAVIDAGLIWIGPSPDAIELLGDKVSARRIAQNVGAPLAPGTVDPVESADEIIAFAREVGLPIAVKAAFGGGGRGLKIAHTLEEIPDAFDSARREAIAAFGRGECFVEKFLERPRHVETQCLADADGNVMVVSTRDCSLQRRNQKLVEEAPAPFVTDAQHQQLVDASKGILREAGYTSAGTCEFLIGADGTISFLEVNTRLQVEHTVSEQVTGLDLVREQFRLAAGGRITAPDPVAHGHAIEFRINGEDPGNGFLPQPGLVRTWRPPTGPGVRIDTGVETGDAVSGAFDSLLAKLIVTGATRQQAIQRARRALAEFRITGVPTVIPFARRIVREPAFIAADGHLGVYTTWIETEFRNDLRPWAGAGAGPGASRPAADAERTNVVLEVDGKRVEVSMPTAIVTGTEGTTQQPAPRRRYHPRSLRRDGSEVLAPMQASVVKVPVAIGDHVVGGDQLVVLEAMKMEQSITAPRDGYVAAIDAAVGQTVPAGHVLLTLSPEPADDVAAAGAGPAAATER